MEAEARGSYDVIVVGAGYGGVTVAALLAKAGRHVLLVDKNPRPGGKAMTIQRQGYTFELWPLVGGPADGSRFHDLAAALGTGADAPLIVPDGDTVEMNYKSPDGAWHRYVAPSKQAEDPMTLTLLQEALGLSSSDLEALLGAVGAILTLDGPELDSLDGVGMLPWLEQFSMPASVRTYFAVMLNLMFIAPADRVPVPEAVRTLRGLFLQGSGRYHAGGFGRPAEMAVAYLESHGGEFLPKTRVRRILTEDGRVSGVETSRGTFRAPIVVSNAGIQPTMLQLIEQGGLPRPYVERVMRLEPSLAMVGIRYFLDAPVFSTPMTLAFSDESWWDTARYQAFLRGELPDVPLVAIITPSLYDETLVPDDEHQLAQLGILGSPDPHSPMNARAIAHAEKVVAEVWPELPLHVERREVYSAASVANLSRDSVVPGQGGECIGLSQVLGQCGSTKPDPRTPLPGLYLVGCDAGGSGMGTQQAVDSGFNVAEMVLADT